MRQQSKAKWRQSLCENEEGITWVTNHKQPRKFVKFLCMTRVDADDVQFKCTTSYEHYPWKYKIDKTAEWEKGKETQAAKKEPTKARKVKEIILILVEGKRMLMMREKNVNWKVDFMNSRRRDEISNTSRQVEILFHRVDFKRILAFLPLQCWYTYTLSHPSSLKIIQFLSSEEFENYSYTWNVKFILLRRDDEMFFKFVLFLLVLMEFQENLEFFVELSMRIFVWKIHTWCLIETESFCALKFRCWEVLLFVKNEILICNKMKIKKKNKFTSIIQWMFNKITFEFTWYGYMDFFRWCTFFFFFSTSTCEIILIFFININSICIWPPHASSPHQHTHTSE